MARLTRTQKFAELRDSLANDKESSLQTKDLSDYEDRLNSITEILSPLSQKEETTPVYETPVIEENDPKYTWTDFEETPIEQLVNSFKDTESEKKIQDVQQGSNIWNALQEAPEEKFDIGNTENTKPLIEEPDYPQPIIGTPIIDLPKEDVKPLIDEDLYIPQEMRDSFRYEDIPTDAKPLIEEFDAMKPAQETPVVTETVEENPYPGYYKPSAEVEALYKEAEEKANEEVTELSTEEVETVEQPEAVLVEEAPIVVEVPEETAQEAPISIEIPEQVEEEAYTAEFVDNHAVVQDEDEVNSYISDMINEVGEYNKMNGDMTISQITNHMVNEVRHPEEAQLMEEVPAVEETPVLQETSEEEIALPQFEDEGDEEFSNTVSMEIAKIMDEIPAVEETPVDIPIEIPDEPIEVEPVEIPEIEVSDIDIPVIEEAVVEPIEEAPAQQTIVVEEHPVLAQALEDEAEDVVEIKNLKELEAEPAKDTVSNTIPFVVTTEDDEEEIEDDDEEGSNTILNIILIILIIVLVAVLGLIVFYILKTKGII